MRFTEFLKATVLLTAGVGVALGVVSAILIVARADDLLAAVAVGWWVIAVVAGMWMGRRAEPFRSLRELLARARQAESLPTPGPARIVLNRLWPLVALTLVAVVLSVFLPAVPVAGAGYAIVWALALRRQAYAVQAIEERDGCCFYVVPQSPFKRLELIRTPGWKSSRVERQPG